MTSSGASASVEVRINVPSGNSKKALPAAVRETKLTGGFLHLLESRVTWEHSTFVHPSVSLTHTQPTFPHNP